MLTCLWTLYRSVHVVKHNKILKMMLKIIISYMLNKQKNSDGVLGAKNITPAILTNLMCL